MNEQASGTARNYLLVSIFVVLLMDQILGLGLSLMPGLSLKNLYLYFVIVYLASSSTIQGKFLTASFPSFYVVFIVLCFYGAASWAVASVVRDNYFTVQHLMSLKNQLVDPLLFFSVMFFGCRSKSDATWIARRMLWMFAIISLVLLVDFVNLPDLGLLEAREDGRLEGAVDGSNTFASLLVFYLLAMTPLTLTRGRSLIMVLGTLAGVALILLTGSRGALAGLVAGAVATTFLLRGRLQLRNIIKVGGAALLVLTAIIAVTVVLYPDMFLDRLERTGGATLAAASSGRTIFWTLGLQQMWASPHSLVIGFGWDTFAYGLIYPDPHNQYLFIFYSMGALGLGLYLWVFSSIFKTAVTALDTADGNDRRYLIAFLYAFSSLMFSMVFATVYTVWPFVWMYTGLMAKLAWLIANQSQEQQAGLPATAIASGPDHRAAMRSIR